MSWPWLTNFLNILYVVATVALAIIGGFGVRYALQTLKAIRRQGDWLSRQTKILLGTLGAIKRQADIYDKQREIMEGQLDHMRQQAREAKESSSKAIEIAQATAEAAKANAAAASKNAEFSRINAEATREIAIAARESANAAIQGVALTMNKERARIEIHATDINPHAGTESFNGVYCWLENCGFTRAFIVESKGKFLNSTSPEMESEQAPNRSLIYSEHIEQGERSDNVLLALEPNAFLTDDDVIKIRKGETFLHFYGFVKYRDIFDRLWTKNVHLRWTMRFGGVVQDSAGDRAKMDWWEPVGRPEENGEIQEEKPN
jgi:hypothetical protein